MQRFISRALPTPTLISTWTSDGASLHFPPNLDVAFSHSHLQEDKGKVRKEGLLSGFNTNYLAYLTVTLSNVL